MQDKVLVIIKPDAIQANCVGTIIADLERAGLWLLRIRNFCLIRSQVEQFLRKQYQDSTYFDNMCEHLSDTQIIACVFGINRITYRKLKTLIGTEDAEIATDESIRGKYGTSLVTNAVYASPTKTQAKADICLFFGEDVYNTEY